MLTARTYGRQKWGTVREGAICSFRRGACLPQDLFSGWGGGWSHSGRGIWDDTRRPAAERMSMMVSTVSNRTALPALRLVSVLVAT